VTGTGKVYRITPVKEPGAEPKVTALFDSGQATVMSLFYCRGDKRLYVGTAEKGAVYSVDRSGASKAEYQSPDHIITGVVRDSKGDLYVASAAQGHLIKIAPNGAVTTLATSEAFYTLYYDRAQDAVFSGDGEGDITQAQVDPLSHESYFLPVCHTEQEAVLAISSDGKGRLFAGTSNLAMARTFDMKPSTSATYTSIVRDAGRQARWSRVRAYGAYNEVSDALARTIQVETRTGETSSPDETWSPWRAASYANDSYVISSASGRYMQYRLVWKPDQEGTKSGGEARPASVGKIEVTYQPTNLPPEFSTISLKTGTACSGKQEVTINATDPDNDNLALAVEVSRDGAKTWTEVASDLRSHHTSTSKETHSSEKTSTSSDSSSKDKSSDDADKSKDLKSDDADKSKDAKNDDSGNKDKTAGPDDKHDSEDAAASSPDMLDASAEEKPSNPDDGDKDKDKDKSKDSDKDKDKDKDAQDKDKDNKEAKKDDQKSDSEKAAKSLEDIRAQAKAALEKLKSKNKLPAGQPLAHVKGTDSGSSGEKFTWNWDTSKLKDGSYVVKFVLNDQPSNPAGHLETVALRTIEIDNAPPEIVSVKLTHEKEKKVSIVVTAHDKHTPIVNATYRFDDGEPFALGSPDNITDGLDADFAVTDINIPHGSHKLEVQVTNKAGNTATKTITL
jgi:hypothetical protein